MSAKPLQVWLVDDDASIRWVLDKALKGSGMVAKSFDQADNALAALRGDAPDVLMTDIRMPGRSGLDLLREIQGSRPGLPVIVMTAHSDLDAAVGRYEAREERSVDEGAATRSSGRSAATGIPPTAASPRAEPKSRRSLPTWPAKATSRSRAARAAPPSR
jgi:CheY-like chemotaxis protein